MNKKSVKIQRLKEMGLKALFTWEKTRAMYPLR